MAITRRKPKSSIIKPVKFPRKMLADILWTLRRFKRTRRGPVLLFSEFIRRAVENELKHIARSNAPGRKQNHRPPQSKKVKSWQKGGGWVKKPKAKRPRAKKIPTMMAKDFRGLSMLEMQEEGRQSRPPHANAA